MVDYLAFFDDQHGNSTMGPPLRFWHGATRGLNPALGGAKPPNTVQNLQICYKFRPRAQDAHTLPELRVSQ